MSTNTPSDLAIEARDLVYQIKTFRLLDRVTFAANQGEFIGVIGPNGAGKTTLLRTISGVLHKTQGTVAIGGRELEKMSRREVAKKLAHLHQIAPYTYGFTSMEIVLMGRYPHLSRFQVEGSSDQAIATESMRLTETIGFADRPITTLSGGERQRVLFARALAQKPRVLLLDEPTANLDIHHQLRVLELVRGLGGSGITAIAAIHDISLAARYCHRLVLMRDGKIVAEGLPKDVVTPANIEAAFQIRSIVYQDPISGGLALSLIGPSQTTAKPGIGIRVHVVSGAGRGARLMYELQQTGFIITAGPLGSGDTDRIAADLMGIEYIPLPPFSPIDDQAQSKHRNMISHADISVLCDMPVGINNVRSLEALACSNRIVILEPDQFQHRDYTDGKAEVLYNSLNNVVRFTSIEQTITHLVSMVQAIKDNASRDNQ